MAQRRRKPNDTSRRTRTNATAVPATKVPESADIAAEDLRSISGGATLAPPPGQTAPGKPSGGIPTTPIPILGGGTQ
jgi:hypothetical protein